MSNEALKLDPAKKALQEEKDRRQQASPDLCQRYDLVVAEPRLLRGVTSKKRQEAIKRNYSIIKPEKGAVLWRERGGDKRVSVEADPQEGDFKYNFCSYCGLLFEGDAEFTRHKASVNHKTKVKEADVSDFNNSIPPMPKELAYLGASQVPMPSYLDPSYHDAW